MPSARPEKIPENYQVVLSAPEPELIAWHESAAPQQLTVMTATELAEFATTVNDRAERWFRQQRLIGTLLPGRITVGTSQPHCDWLSEGPYWPTANNEIDLEAIEFLLIPQLINLAEQAPSWNLADWQTLSWVKQLHFSIRVTETEQLQFSISGQYPSHWALHAVEIPPTAPFAQLSSIIEQAVNQVIMLDARRPEPAADKQQIFHQARALFTWPDTIELIAEATRMEPHQLFDFHSQDRRQTSTLAACQPEKLDFPAPPAARAADPPLSAEEIVAILKDHLPDQALVNHQPGFDPDFGIKY